MLLVFIFQSCNTFLTRHNQFVTDAQQSRILALTLLSYQGPDNFPTVTRSIMDQAIVKRVRNNDIKIAKYNDKIKFMYGGVPCGSRKSIIFNISNKTCII